MVAAAVGMQVLRLASRSRPRSPRSSRAPTTRSAWRRSRRANIRLVRLARGRLDRRGRAVADGARGPRDDARRARQHRPLPVRREPDGRGWSRQMADREGIVLPAHDPRRRRRSSTARSERFPIGGSKVLRQSGDDAGDRRRRDHAARGAEGRRQLEREGIAVRVVDLYSVKPIDVDDAARGGRGDRRPVVIVEDHWPEGGLGDAVLEACRTTASCRRRSCAWPSARCRAPASRPSCSPQPGSTPTTSPRRPELSWAPRYPPRSGGGRARAAARARRRRSPCAPDPARALGRAARARARSRAAPARARPRRAPNPRRPSRP